jgi:hypothetical protein
MTTLESPAVSMTVARPERLWVRTALVLVALYLAAALPLILLMGPMGRPGEDQINYHEPAVHTFAQQLPRPDVSDYLSATTPGYHLTLATVERMVSGDDRVLQLAGAGFTVLLLVVLARVVTSFLRGGWVESLVLCLPFAVSMYVVQAGVWILPDNAGWLFVLVCLALAFAEPYGNRTIILGGLGLIGVVLFRQVHLWVAGPLWAAAWLAPGISRPAGVRQLLDRLPQRLRSLLPMVAATVPAALILVLFAWAWGGLTPPSFRAQYKGVNWAAFAFVLSLLGVGSVFFLGYVVDPLADLLRSRRLYLAGAAGALVAAIPKTTFSVEEGRFSGMWRLATKVPDIAGRTSPVIVVLSAFGAMMLMVWWRALTDRDRWIMLGTWLAFASAQAASFQLWQRYNEPMVLLMLAIMASRSRRSGVHAPIVDRLVAPARLGGVALLSVLLAGFTALMIARFQPANLYDIQSVISPVEHPRP